MRCATAGPFSVEDHRAMTREIVSDARWRPGMNALFDHSNLDFGDTGFKEMFEASETHREHDGEIGAGKAAILVSGTSDYGVARSFTNLVSGRVAAEMAVFKNEAEALAWLVDDEPSA